MTSAAEIISDGLALVLVDEESISLQPGELAIGVRFLNDWCAQQHAEGVDFGYRPVTAPDDIITSPSSVNLTLKHIIGTLLAPIFGIPVPLDVHAQARKSESALFNQFFEIEDSHLPTTLPRGSGNESWSGGRYFEHYYSIRVPEAFLRLDASTTVTITTINTPVQVTGPWVIDRDINTTSTTAGLIRFDLKGSYLATLEASLTINIADGDQFTFYFLKNGAILEQSRLVFDADAAQNVLIKWVGTLRDTDDISLWVENNNDTTNLTITNGHFRIF